MACQWLHHWNIPYIRLNEENEVNPIVGIEYEKEDIKVLVHKDGCQYDLSKLHKTWFRRRYFLFRHIDDIPTLAAETNKSIREHLANDGKSLERFLYYYLSKGD